MRNAAARIRFELEDGLEVICQGDIDVYAPRGSYQLVIRQIEPKGIGALELACATPPNAWRPKAFSRPSANGRSRASRAASLSSPVRPAPRLDFLEVLRRRWRGCAVDYRAHARAGRRWKSLSSVAARRSNSSRGVRCH